MCCTRTCRIADLALPTLLAVDLPPMIGALTLAGVLAAEISAADAVLFMLSTSSSQDLYRRFIAPDATDTQVLRVARLAAVVAGIAGVGMAIVIPTVVDALTDLLRRRHSDAVRAGRGVASHHAWRTARRPGRNGRRPGDMGCGAPSASRTAGSLAFRRRPAAWSHRHWRSWSTLALRGRR